MPRAKPPKATRNCTGQPRTALRVSIDRHGPAPGGDRFLLLHRRRVWNESQRQWIGWERKRGKLHELNRLLRGASDTTFLTTDGHPPRVPQNVRYVITLDADTMLPRDTVRRLIGKMAHPLNQPRLDNATNRVVEGHAVLQPRVTAALPMGAEGSLYQRAFASLGGIDPYAAAMSDVYQDLFEEGSYTGKGIYAVDAFETALAGRTPNSTLLSHDLFEGVFARAGLASDVEVVEAYPTRYDVAALRYHRWARGDWQLLPWILGWNVLLGEARRRSAMMPASGRWKMVDNLRRTSSPITCLLALMAGWLLPFDAAVIWTLFVLGTIALPSFAPVLAATIVPRHASLSLSHHIRSIMADFRVACLQSMFDCRVPGSSGLADERRDHPHPVEIVHFSARSSRMDAGQPSQHRSETDPACLLSMDGRRGLYRPGGPRGGLDLRRSDVAHRRAVWRFVVRFSGNCLLG